MAKEQAVSKKCDIVVFGLFKKDYLNFLMKQFSVRKVENERVIVSVET